jgi:hypothetical protein
MFFVAWPAGNAPFAYGINLPPIPHDLNGVSHNGIAGTEDNFMALDASGKPKDSESKASDFEPAIGAKGTAFNRDFGVVSDAVCEGDDPRLSNARTPTVHALDGAEHSGVAGTENNFMALDAAGKPKDSLSKAADFEPAIGAKGTAFNKNFGAGAGDVAEGNATVNLTGDQTVAGKKIFDDYCRVNGRLTVNIDPAATNRTMHVRGDVLRFDRSLEVGGGGPEIMMTQYSSGYATLWKTFSLSVGASGLDTGFFELIDRHQYAGGHPSANIRMKVGNNGEFFFPDVFGATVVGGTTLYMKSDGEIGTTTSLREAKTNIVSLTEVDLGWFDELEFVMFNFRQRDENGNYTDEPMPCLEFGGIAQDFEQINPDLVSYQEGEYVYNEETRLHEFKPLDEKILKGIHYEKLISVMAHKIQNLEARVKTLEEQ